MYHINPHVVFIIVLLQFGTENEVITWEREVMPRILTSYKKMW